MYDNMITYPSQFRYCDSHQGLKMNMSLILFVSTLTKTRDKNVHSPISQRVNTAGGGAAAGFQQEALCSGCMLHPLTQNTDKETRQAVIMFLG